MAFTNQTSWEHGSALPVLTALPCVPTSTIHTGMLCHLEHPKMQQVDQTTRSASGCRLDVIDCSARHSITTDAVDNSSHHNERSKVEKKDEVLEREASIDVPYINRY
ncbi:hypothetical protein BJ508DRAFT_175762 [Ascobolus immersus RN42]|uniref:Uncharacterized protein n=1 Tax=Ascobolus immersus RN42 TaxID=1160509 RepID=A0A3N4HYS8_ASCIM|nr:hypothetical protein BJ508DRAFT_175762 [Ascobolus immersus RN42]